MFKIISKKRYEELLTSEYQVNEYRKANARRAVERMSEKEITYNCGYKSCQFQTTDPKGLKIHRTRIHKNT